MIDYPGKGLEPRASSVLVSQNPRVARTILIISIDPIIVENDPITIDELNIEAM